MVAIDERPPAEVAAPAAAEAAEAPSRIERYTLTTGIVLKIKPVSPRAMRDAADRIEKPQPPRVWNANRGTTQDDPKDRGWEENPNDPHYIEAMQQYTRDTNDASLHVGMILGTEVEEVPGGLYGPAEDGWFAEITEPYEIIGQVPPALRATPPKARYLDWLLYYAIGAQDDLLALQVILMSAIFPTEEGVRRVMDSFRRSA